ncbi:hypothetical protein [Natrononativus amylolyticus]|uniref:hypothetical protein n=1 Tax=Natrononativus amylolyticus TaxID=2963434 RepID=UPI0020CC2022|nr:hypothetical protein [Natrononativus amylolyticus]
MLETAVGLLEVGFVYGLVIVIFVFGIGLILGSNEATALLVRTDAEALERFRDSSAAAGGLVNWMATITGLFFALFAGAGLLLLLYDHALVRADAIVPASASAVFLFWTAGMYALLAPHVTALPADSFEDDPTAAVVIAVLCVLLGSLLWLLRTG